MGFAPGQKKPIEYRVLGIIVGLVMLDYVKFLRFILIATVCITILPFLPYLLAIIIMAIVFYGSEAFSGLFERYIANIFQDSATFIDRANDGGNFPDPDSKADSAKQTQVRAVIMKPQPRIKLREPIWFTPPRKRRAW